MLLPLSFAMNREKKKKPEEEFDDDDGPEFRGKRTPRSASDVQRARLEKLMKKPDKPVHIPTQRKERDPNKAPEFVYNVMGSSAGAGSGEFHVYRQYRRKETLRMNVLSARKEKDDLNDAYHQKLAENERVAEERTAKKRGKRNKKKEAAKKRKAEAKKKQKKAAAKEESSSSSSSSSEEEESDEEEAKEKVAKESEKDEDTKQKDEKAKEPVKKDEGEKKKEVDEESNNSS